MRVDGEVVNHNECINESAMLKVHAEPTQMLEQGGARETLKRRTSTRSMKIRTRRMNVRITMKAVTNEESTV